jgi:hypothetical protein
MGAGGNKKKQKKKTSVALFRKRTIPTERLPLVGETAVYCENQTKDTNTLCAQNTEF